MAATIVPKADPKNAQILPGICPSSSIIFARLDNPNITPEMSNKPTNKKARRGGSISQDKEEDLKSMFLVTPY